MFWIQSVGLLGMALDVYASLHKKDKHLIYLHSLGSFVFSLHFFLLGAYTGAISEFLNGTRTGISFFTKNRFVAYGFLILYGALLIILPNNLLDTLPFIASLAITIGLYFFENIKMRSFYLFAWMLWLAYSVLLGSIGGTILFTLLIVTTSTTIYRLKINNAQN